MTANFAPPKLNSGCCYRDRVDRKSAGATVLDFYSQRYEHSSRAAWQERIQAGQIWLDGQPTAAETCLQEGQELAYHRPPWEEPAVPLDFTIAHEDADLLVVVKPAGLPVLPGGGFLEHTLLWQLQQRYSGSAPVPIHRLGRGTSGLLLLSRSAAARAALSHQMRHRQIHKTYWAIAAGTSIPDRFTVTQPIGKVPYPTLGYLYAASAEGRPAASECRVLQRGDRASLLEVVIRTGRPHQIRIHLAVAGCPLWGDPLYDLGGVPLPQSQTKLAVPGDCGYLLHAQRLQFRHPTSDRSLVLSCPVPQAAWATALDSLQIDLPAPAPTSDER